jgi:hypothetical protein
VRPLALAVASLAATPLLAASIAQRSLADMARGADHVVHVRVLDARAALEGDGAIWTTCTLEVVEPLQPDDPPAGARLLVKQLGGRVGDLALVAPGVPQLAPGEEAILFTKDHGRGWQSITNAWQGHVRIAAGVAGGLAPAVLGVPEAPQLYPEAATTDLASFKAAVRAALGSPGD